MAGRERRGRGRGCRRPGKFGGIQGSSTIIISADRHGSGNKDTVGAYSTLAENGSNTTSLAGAGSTVGVAGNNDTVTAPDGGVYTLSGQNDTVAVTSCGIVVTASA